MGIEGKHDRGSVDASGLSYQSFDDAGMPSMHAIKVPDRDSAAAQVSG
jgi:hypothetical protein